ncbi:MAG: hypothetical protein JWM12_3750 [Ilumatobacteraceae bacterium]|nr:hypothetical protein [Ilumatobacteraceae bacterium]
MAYDLIDIELCTDGTAIDEPAQRTWADGALIVARHHGVPVGSALVHGQPPTTTSPEQIIDRRNGDPADAADGPPISITVAVCTRNRPQLLERCIGSIHEAILAAGTEVEADVLVIDNASTDQRTMDAARALGADAREEPVAGLDVARNHAVRVSRGAVLAFVDDDVMVDRMWLRTLARTMQANEDALAVTGGVLALRLDTDAQVEFERCGGFFKSWASGPVTDGSHSELPFNPSIGVGCNMAFRRRAFELAGMFDEALDTGPPLAGGGDLDMLIRVARAGVVVYEPSALVRHEHRQTFDALRRQYLSWGKSWGAVLHKWYRQSPGERPVIRRAALNAIRFYVHDFVLPTRGTRRRRVDAGLMLVGFVAGITVAYPRSVRRMAGRSSAAVRSAVDHDPASPPIDLR